LPFFGYFHHDVISEEQDVTNLVFL